MESLFYLTRFTINLDDISSHARSQGYVCDKQLFQNSVNLRVYNDRVIESIVRNNSDSEIAYHREERRDLWIWEMWHDIEELEPEERECLQSISPSRVFTIWYHSSSLEDLKGYLQVVLSEYDGYIASDNFCHLYDVTSLSDLSAP